ncbi:MAG TPA: hypothetical protein VJM46_01885 [Candidatus Saccharimonadales bacterium]|nr:hypothetical protein [Candidatus Saccharimonadales bacterium]
MSVTAETRLRQFYALFGGQRFAELRDFLAPDVWYIQINTMTADNSPRGSQAVGRQYINWGRWFHGLRIGALEMTAGSEAQTRRVGGAEINFTVRYGLVARYAQRMPGMQMMQLPAIGGVVRLVMTDRVWMDGDNRILRVVNSIQPADE